MRTHVQIKKSLLAIAWLLISGLNAQATTYYCSPNGKGNGKSYASPCSLSNGLNYLTEGGDTLYLLGGQYNLGKTSINNKIGSKSHYIVISGYPGENAILDFRTTPYGTRGLQLNSSCSYVCVRCLTLRYSGKNNLYNEGSNCLFENLDIYGSADSGCQMKSGGNNMIVNCDSHDNFDYETGGLTGANFGGNADGFADKQHSGSPNHYIGCRAWNNSDDGWDFYQRVTSGETIIEHCICYKNGLKEYDMRQHPRYQTDKSWFDQFASGKNVVDRYSKSSTVTLEHYTNWGNGNGFKLGGDHTSHQVKVIQSLSVDNSARGFDQNNNSGTMVLLNNTGSYNSPDFGFTTSCGTLTIQNNLSYLSRSGNAHMSQNTLSDNNNIWNLTSITLSDQDFLSVDTSLILAPRMADGSLADSLYLRPKATSVFVDKGVNVNLKYYGDAPDLGCYEYEIGEPTMPKEDEEEKPEPYVCKDGSHAVAWISSEDCEEDKPLLEYLKKNDSLCITVLDAAYSQHDYTNYEVIVIAPKPTSTSAAFTKLKGYPKPMLVLKPFLFKNTVWNWGTAVNTQDLSIEVKAPSHPLFTGIELDNNQKVALFSRCQQNAVTALSGWIGVSEPIQALATPVSQKNYTSIADLAAGTELNGTILAKPLVMIGVSEYSTLYLTQAGMRIIENAIMYLLGCPMSTALSEREQDFCAEKILTREGILIRKDAQLYDLLGNKISIK